MLVVAAGVGGRLGRGREDLSQVREVAELVVLVLRLRLRPLLLLLWICWPAAIAAVAVLGGEAVREERGRLFLLLLWLMRGVGGVSKVSFFFPFPSTSTMSTTTSKSRADVNASRFAIYDSLSELPPIIPPGFSLPIQPRWNRTLLLITCLAVVGAEEDAGACAAALC